MTGMRVNANAAQEVSKYWRQPMAYADFLAQVNETDNPKALIEKLAPQGKFYAALRDELIRLSRESSRKENQPPLRFTGKTFYPGDRSADMPALRARLDVTHNPKKGPENFYDDDPAAAVMRFQRENGLDADGVIGQKTLALLNRNVRSQMEQVVANMERLRWMDTEKPERYILVNIPSQRLWAVEKGDVVHEMDVIVGKPERQTKAFKAEVQGIRFNPKWNVPPGIKVKDFLPKLREDPTYLAQKGIQIYVGSGADRRTIDGTEIDWSTMRASDMNRLTMVQQEGANNALGRIRVLMPNDYDIYLHDTNTPEYFNKSKRTLSSGCVRMSHPEDIARFVLSSNPGWSEQKMQQTLARGSTAEVMAKNPFPVYIVYQTMWLDAEGRLVYGEDVYKRDQRLIKVLADAGSLHIPGSDSTRVAERADSSTKKF
jgi:murein L,D-transpeptidase YcbB/YkuD